MMSVGNRIHGAVAHQLGVAIVGGKHRPGDILSDEISASQELGISRTAYREAIRVLGAKGLVVSRPKRGTTINARDCWNHLDPDVLAWSFEARPSEQLINDLFEIRAVIEPAAAALAAQRRDKGQLARMEIALVTMQQETILSPKGQLADIDFHRALLEATRNEAMVSLSSGIAATVLWTNEFKQAREGFPRDPIPDHQRVFEAVRDMKPTAASRAMSELIQLALADTRLSLATA